MGKCFPRKETLSPKTIWLYALFKSYDQACKDEQNQVLY